MSVRWHLLKVRVDYLHMHNFKCLAATGEGEGEGEQGGEGKRGFVTTHTICRKADLLKKKIKIQ